LTPGLTISGRVVEDATDRPLAVADGLDVAQGRLDNIVLGKRV